jgi:hypothetical protein
MEFAVFEQLQKNAATQGATLWGALSWRFGEKTGMLGNDWVKQIVDHPGYDVYFCNPHTHNEAIFHNMWLQGETSHPNFLEITRAFFQAAGLDEKEIMSILPITDVVLDVVTELLGKHERVEIGKVLDAVRRRSPDWVKPKGRFKTFLKDIFKQKNMVHYVTENGYLFDSSR